MHIVKMDLDIEKVLKSKRINYRVIKLSEKGISFEDVIKFSEEKINSNEICKTIIVKDKKGNKFAFLLKGDQKMDFKKAKEILGSKASIVSYEDLKKTTGIEPGAVCPIGLKFSLFVDKMVFETEKINFGSGDHLFGLEINSNDLEKMVDFKMVDVS